MVDRATFDRIKQRHGLYASWAVWAEAAYTPKSNMGDLRVLDPDLNPSLLQILRNDVIMVGLNISKPGVVVEPFRNFHGGIGGAYKIRYAFVGTPFYGAYMTDFIKGVEMLESGALMRYVREHPSVVRESVATLHAELNDLHCRRPTILTFGGDTHRLVAEHVHGDKYSRLIRIRHYSDYISPQEYRQVVLSQIASSSNLPREADSYTEQRGHRFAIDGVQPQDRDETMRRTHRDPGGLTLDANADDDSGRLPVSTVSRKPRTDPYYQKIDALADQGAHRTHVHQVADVPRVYEGRCFECGWRGSETTGTTALKEMLAHTQSTLPVR
jgi:hypothetical protein